MEEARNSHYSMHPGATKMYQDLKKHFWWMRIKRTISNYVARHLNFQQVKYEHQKPGGLAQNLVIPDYQSSIEMPPYEALYDRQCRSPVGWFEPDQKMLLGPEMVQQAFDKIKVTQDWLKTS
ncbi:uncharacterized protein LOC132601438 [Lycium barbarum]|uniref:uncharacterized protein LOC132601438 n=1 Tax=Lycium barbarum TaxID=112863 RepID=UPI00293E333E|nr:uncharacterized protein LOC132601438 [Lycium barbarum]